MAPSAATACLLAGRQELLSIQGAAAVWQLSGTTTLTRALGTPPSGVQPTSCAVPRLDHHGALRPHQALFCSAPTALHVPFAVRGLATQAAPAISSDQAGSAVPESERDQAKDRKLGARGDTSTYDAGYVAPHPSMASHGVTGAQAAHDPGDCTKETGMPRAMVYDMAYLESVKPIHLPPKTLADRLGLLGVRILRRSFDMLTGYGPNMTEAKWLRRIIFLETVAGVPGMVGGMLRHLHSLRVMRRDKGWIHCLLEEAENERMHLITFMELRKPGPLFRAMVLLAQGVFFNAFFLAYLVWPQVCHAFVGYLEEEAVRTYTHALKDIDEGRVWQGVQAPPIAQSYWGLAPGASMRELILAVRADEACHSHVNHTLKAIKQDSPNPFALGKSQLP